MNFDRELGEFFINVKHSLVDKLPIVIGVSVGIAIGKFLGVL